MKTLLLLILVFLLAVSMTGFAVQARESDHAVDGYEFTILEENAEKKAQEPENRDSNPATADRTAMVFMIAASAVAATILLKKRAL